jgi:hypothetical protein
MKQILPSVRLGLITKSQVQVLTAPFSPSREYIASFTTIIGTGFNTIASDKVVFSGFLVTVNTATNIVLKSTVSSCFVNNRIV